MLNSEYWSVKNHPTPGGLLNGNKTAQNICVYTEAIESWIMEMESYGYWSVVSSLQLAVTGIQYSSFGVRHSTLTVKE